MTAGKPQRPKKEPVQRRPMTLLERHRALALMFCRMRRGSPGQTFARVMGRRVAEASIEKVPPLVSAREAAALERLSWGLREQLRARKDGHLVPEEEPAPRTKAAPVRLVESVESPPPAEQGLVRQLPLPLRPVVVVPAEPARGDG